MLINSCRKTISVIMARSQRGDLESLNKAYDEILEEIGDGTKYLDSGYFVVISILLPVSVLFLLLPVLIPLVSFLLLPSSPHSPSPHSLLSLSCPTIFHLTQPIRIPFPHVS